MAETSSQRLVRLISMLAYLNNAGQVPMSHLAQRFGTTPAQIKKDINFLWLSGRPGGMPDDLIDFDSDDFDRGIATLREAQDAHTTFGLSDREVLALSASLQALRATVQQVGIDGPVAALFDDTNEALLRTEPDAENGVDVQWFNAVEPGIFDLVRQAVRDGHRIEIDYTSLSDQTTTRTIEPLRITSESGRTYVEAWCLAAGGARRFRLDRIGSVTPLREPNEHATGELGDSIVGGFNFDESAISVRLTLTSQARAVAEQVRLDALTEHGDGTFTVEFRTSDREWLTGLLLQHADRLVAVDPPQLQEDAARRARRALAHYTERYAFAAAGERDPATDEHDPAAADGTRVEPIG
ncbi:helix-turn-helix transcriptional regulator [Rarobacter incanus]|uniref:Proteasome accessory factor C n=1 Tax=Rarobacter incanus TaxID=153494 RepID=A0A542SM25_9MICO|nr:WYL domain-containing protein [Rarobacter incanus]TQK75679.1 proteasome accessory factor C [Rarobacter incanus]